ncbi:MAG TPA: hypothetical protein VLA87_04610 [Gaiellaceae bacterium]|nr:hypothetical protein [Gaiellaceae bacterium]
MTKQRNSLLDLHPVSVASSLLGGGPMGSAAPHDAEPEVYEPRPSRVRRLLAAIRARRASATSAETGRA